MKFFGNSCYQISELNKKCKKGENDESGENGDNDSNDKSNDCNNILHTNKATIDIVCGILNRMVSFLLPNDDT